MRDLRLRVREAKGTPAVAGSRNHAAHELARALKRKHKRLVGRFNRAALDIPAAPEPNEIADYLVPNRSDRWKTRRRKKKDITIRSFSFIDDPENVISILSGIAISECENINSRLHFLMPRCLDIAPLLVLGLMRRGMFSPFDGGYVEDAVAKVMSGVGLEDFMQMPLSDFQPQLDVWPFPLSEKPKTVLQEPKEVGKQRREKVATDFVSSINRWLTLATSQGEEVFELTEHGRGGIQNVFCEILENAERHGVEGSTFSNGWACAGFLARSETSSTSRDSDYVCHLAFVNTGRSISEGLIRSEHEQSRAIIDSYLNTHRRAIKRKPELAEALRTVMAIQPGITRQQYADTTAGGVGFRTIINAIHALAGRSPSGSAISIVSGRACVRVADPYSSVYETDGRSPYLFFNAENNPNTLPDREHVFTLRKGFPGTIIAARFTIDPIRPPSDDG